MSEMVTRFLGALVANKLVDSAPFKDGKGAIVISDKILPFAIKEKGFAVGGDTPLECYCPNPEASLIRVLSNKIFGTTTAKFKDTVYNSVNIYPKAIRSDGIIFATANGKEFLTSSSNTRVTLGLYDILYSRNADSSILMLPELLPSGSNVVNIASQKVRDCFVSLKNEVLSASLTTVTDEAIVSGKDTKKAMQVNAIYSDKSALGASAPLNKDLLQVSESTTLTSSKTGYILSSDLSTNTGITYHLEESVKPDFSLVQSSVLAANHVVSDLEKGVIFSSNHRQAVQNLRQHAVPLSEETTIACSEERSPAGRVSTYWGIPVNGDSVKSVVWSY